MGRLRYWHLYHPRAYTTCYQRCPNANLTGADLSNTNLTDANLTGANLTNAYLSGTFLYRANLTNANLSSATVTGHLDDTDLSNANLSGATIYYANLSGTNLTNTNLYGAAMTGVHSGGIIGIPAALPTGWQLINGYLIGQAAYLHSAYLPYTDLSGSNLSNAHLYTRSPVRH